MKANPPRPIERFDEADEHWHKLELYTRGGNALSLAEERGLLISTSVRAVALLTEQQLLELPGCGPHAVADIQRCLHDRGLRLGMERRELELLR